MPTLFSYLARSNGKNVAVDSVTRGGWCIGWYLDKDNEQARMLDRLLESNHYDLCVLQENSVVPVTDFDFFHSGMCRMREKMKQSVDNFLLYETWGRKEGNSKLLELGITRKEMTEKLAESYAKVSTELNIPVSHVGQNFYKANQLCPELDLYDADLTHPNYTGSCLSALTHYYAIFGEYPENTNILGLDEDIAELLKKVVTNL